MTPEKHQTPRAPVSNDDTPRIDLADRITLRPVEAASALGISERTLRTWMRDEGFPFFRVDNGVVCIPVADLREWMADRVESSHRCDAIVAEMLQDLGE